jgi:hypothetical protein
MGVSAGYFGQGSAAVAIGINAGQTAQGTGAVAIGVNAGAQSQGTQAIAIGNSAGYTAQGANAIAIGNSAGKTQQGANSIIIDASGGVITSQESGFYVAPVRSAVGYNNFLFYDETTNEINRNTIFSITNDGKLRVTISGTTYIFIASSTEQVP